MNNSKLKEQDILEFLSNIQEGKIKISAIIDPKKVYSGDVVYIASNGWEITIFNDANTWDYIDNIKINNDLRVNFEELDNMILLRNYVPPIEVVNEIYKIPEKS